MKSSNIVISVLALALIVFSVKAYTHGHRFGEFNTCDGEESFISVDIVCDEDPSIVTKNLKATTEDVVEKYISNNTAEKISVFYRDLGNRQWFGINENTAFSPGSLLKLPLAIAYYKLSEIDPAILEKELEYNPTNSREQSIESEEKLVPGRAYRIGDLITRMIKDSDNEAVAPLYGSINKDFLDKVYVDLGVYIPVVGGLEQDFISVKTYGAILRSLYNASYLSRLGSNNLLTIMSQSTFRDGIKAGLPASVKLANKFGEVSIISGGTLAYVELHDCGIIYPAKNPYILCIMTKGHDFEELSKAIADISKTVYTARE